MTQPVPAPQTPLTPHAVHIPPPPRDLEPRTRPPMVFWDRAKVLIILGTVLVLLAAFRQARVPIMSWREAFDEQLRAKWWIVGLMGLEALRQLHYVISEHSSAWHLFWQDKVFGGWERRMSKLNPWNRYRCQRAFKLVTFITVAGLFASYAWNTSFVEAIVTAPARMWDTLFTPMTGGLPLFWLMLLYSFMGVFQLIIFFGIFFVGGIETYKPGEIKTRFTDVWGQDPVLNRVRETVDFLERPAEIEAKGGYVPSGILLWGPPGTGKTLMAEAVAGETGKPYVFVDPSAFIQTFMGVAPMKIKWMYRKVRKLALRNGGVVVFFDEADALGNRGTTGGFDEQQAKNAWNDAHRCNASCYVDQRTNSVLWHEHRAAFTAKADPEPRQKRRGIIVTGGGGGGMGALQALLTEMSGLNKPRGFFSRRIRSFLGMKRKLPPKYRILHIMATNRPDTLDAALLRPGRIDRKYKVGYPHAEGRKRTFQGYFDKIRHDLTDEQVERLALVTPYYTGAMVKDIVNEAVIVALRDHRDVVTWSDVLRAKMLKRYGEADDWKYTELERHQVAIHEACHAVAMYLLRKRHIIDVATIERRGDIGGFVNDIPVEERFGEWRSEIEIDVMTFLASLAGERLFFNGDNSAGVTGDLRSATAMVTRMLAFHGMGRTIGSRLVTIPEMTGASSRPSDGMDRQFLESEIGRDVEAKLQDLLDQVHSLLDQNRWFVCAIAHALESHLTITGEDIDAIYRGIRGPTVDGAVYRTDWFLREYGSYLTAAHEAHQGHVPLVLPLPRPATTAASYLDPYDPYGALRRGGVAVAQEAPPQQAPPPNGHPPQGGNGYPPQAPPGGNGGYPQAPPGGHPPQGHG